MRYLHKFLFTSPLLALALAPAVFGEQSAVIEEILVTSEFRSRDVDRTAGSVRQVTGNARRFRSGDGCPTNGDTQAAGCHGDGPDVSQPQVPFHTRDTGPCTGWSGG